MFGCSIYFSCLLHFYAYILCFFLCTCIYLYCWLWNGNKISFFFCREYTRKKKIVDKITMICLFFFCCDLHIDVAKPCFCYFPIHLSAVDTTHSSWILFIYLVYRYISDSETNLFNFHFKRYWNIYRKCRIQFYDNEQIE